jgi:hypothetical protein
MVPSAPRRNCSSDPGRGHCPCSRKHLGQAIVAALDDLLADLLVGVFGDDQVFGGGGGVREAAASASGIQRDVSSAR